MAEADKHLTYALEHCHKEYHGNIRRILEYLIPVKLILGYLPDEELLKRQELSHLSGLVKCVKIGDVRKLSEELERNQHLYISKGLYLSLDRLKVIAYRNLIRAVVSIHQENVKADATQKATNAQRVPLRMLVNPFKRYGDSDLLELAEDKKDDSGVSIQIMDQIKCILSNLIFKGYVKGYISHEKSFLVLSANQPFPPVKNGRLF